MRVPSEEMRLDIEGEPSEDGLCPIRVGGGSMPVDHVEQIGGIVQETSPGLKVIKHEVAGLVSKHKSLPTKIQLTIDEDDA
jgi:hypothetical protein